MQLLFIITIVFTISLNCCKGDWDVYKQKHGKVYRNRVEEVVRKDNFHKNKALITDHNEKFERGLTSFKMKINKFSDMNLEEFKTTMHAYSNISDHIHENRNDSTPSKNASNIPDSIDWRELGAVTEVKSQGSCLSCWAFSTTGVLEGQLFRKTGKLVSLSEQVLLDCMNIGCNRGNMISAYNFLKKFNAIESEINYPYSGKEQVCKYEPNKKEPLAAIKEIKVLPKGDEEALKIAVATVGPIAVAIKANIFSFKHYSGTGVYYDHECTFGENDHAVLVVGYGTTEDGVDYWLVKNSYGKDWGDNGYIKIARNKNDHCGIAKDASYPILY